MEYLVDAIRREGFQRKGSNPFYDGVHTSGDPEAWAGKWGDVCFFGDVPEAVLDPEWEKERRSPTSMWVLPYDVATKYLTQVSPNPTAD